MGNIESKKLHLIKQIASLNDANILLELENVLNQAHKDTVLLKLAKPRKHKLDIEALKKEQKFTTFNRKRFDKIIKELAIEEPIEQLLEMI